MPSRTVIVAGAGIGGLTASLALVRNGFRVVTIEQTERLEETGAGIQLSPNATRVLIELGLGDRLRPHIVAPTALRVLTGHSGREIMRMPIGETAAKRYGSPYWMIHRGDLQAVLAAAVAQELEISLKLGMRVEDFATHANGVTVSARGASGLWDERGDALIAADGLWSAAREQLGFKDAPQFSRRTAWRTLLPATEVVPEFRQPMIHLWLGRDAHLVHYPVKAGAMINIVVITTDSWNGTSWSEPATRVELLPHLPAARLGAAGHALWSVSRNPAEMGAVPPAAADELVAGCGGATRGRRPSDAAVPCPRRGHGDRRRRRSGALSGAIAPTMPRRRCGPMLRCGAHRARKVQKLRGKERRALSPRRRGGYAAQCGDARHGRRASLAAL